MLQWDSLHTLIVLYYYLEEAKAMDNLVPDDEIRFDELCSRNDLALIGEDVGSREELLDTLRKYLMLTRRDRRFSDYYSVRLFGYTVPDMFIKMSYRYRFESPIPINETLLISEPDLYYNKKAFDEGKINLCFVIGYSGSGKSVLTKEYEGEDIEKVSLDDIVCVKDHYTLDELKAMGDLLYSFFSGEGSKYYISINERDMFADRGEVFVKFIKFAMKFASDHPEKKYILEGIWTYLFFSDPSKFKKYAVYMKGTSLLKSKLRRIKREAANDPMTSLDRLFEFGFYAADTTFRDSNVDKWRRYFEKRPETVMKLEDNKFKTIRDNIMAEVNNINDCFVHGDADGIKEIMKNTENNGDMNITERAFIVEECKKAIADM